MHTYSVCTFPFALGSGILSKVSILGAIIGDVRGCTSSSVLRCWLLAATGMCKGVVGRDEDSGEGV